jgi:endo-1,4-beta-xylanase
MKKRLSSTRTLILSISVFALSAAIMLLSSFGGNGSKNAAGEQDSYKGLKDYYKDYFAIGVAVGPNTILGEQGELVKKNFNSLTCENVMKPALIHPEENKYNWDNPDKIVSFAQANGMKVRGHTLCWHSQTGAWMFKDAQGNQVTREVALARLKDHITTVVSHFKGKVYAWDVLNEAVIDGADPNKIYRESNWYKIIGEEYIPKVYQWAHEADPNAVLFYNDYNTENPVKRDKIYNLLKKLLAQGVPINAVGLQGHWNVNNPSEQNLKDAIDKFSSLGLKVQITELDVSVIGSRTDTTKVFTPEREQRQMDFYKMAFKVFREKRNVITGVTFWNLTDGRSWLDRGKIQTYPLLFDFNMKPKKAFWEVVNF